MIISQLEKITERPSVRVVPVEKEVKIGQEEVLPSEKFIKLLDDYDVIALKNCYCRQEKI